MLLNSRERMELLITAMEDTCRVFRKNLEMKLPIMGENVNEDSDMKNVDTSGYDMSSQSADGDTPLYEMDIEYGKVDPFEKEPQKRIGRPKTRNTNQKSINSGKTTNHSGYQIRDWKSKFFQALNGKELTGMEIFNELHNAKLIVYKGSDQQKAMYKRFRKTLFRLQKDGIIEQISDAHNAPWRWIGGALMVGQRHKKEELKNLDDAKNQD